MQIHDPTAPPPGLLPEQLSTYDVHTAPLRLRAAAGATAGANHYEYRTSNRRLDYCCSVPLGNILRTPLGTLAHTLI